jgi:hypothetical protein
MEPMTMMALMAGAQAAGGMVQKISSAIKRRKAKREFQPYSIPSSAKAMLDKATSLSTLRGVPGEDIYRSQAQASVARGTEAAERTAESSGDVLSVLSKLHGRDYMDYERNLAAQGEQSYERRQSNLMNSLMQFSQLETQRWQYNELYPYMQAMGEAGQIDEAANVNLQSAIGAGMNIYGAKADMDFQQKMQDQWINWKLGDNTGEPFGRTRGQEAGVRNLAQPQVSGWEGTLNQDYRTPLYPFK